MYLSSFVMFMNGVKICVQRGFEGFVVEQHFFYCDCFELLCFKWYFKGNIQHFSVMFFLNSYILNCI
jgi:hypothetical protein